MKADPEFVREHYKSLSDEELLAVDRSDLVEMAQKYYDAEVGRRGLARVRTPDRPSSVPVPPDNPPVEKVETGREALESDDTPPWLDEAVEAYSIVVHPDAESRVADACQVLETAGIPCCSELIELTPEEKRPHPGTHRWRILVPANLNERAMSTLERDLSNPEFEAAWKAHLETFSDDDLPAMHPKIVFCGLYDRIERAARVYDAEVARRRLNRE